MTFATFMSEYGFNIITAIITALCGYIGVVAKNLFKKYVTDNTKRSVVDVCVMAAEQMYKSLHGEEKLNKCAESAIAMLAEKGIVITDLEVKMLIESAVGEFNKAFNK